MTQRGPAGKWESQRAIESQREPERARERASKGLRDPEPEGARVGVTKASLTFLACLIIVLSQNN